MPTIGTDGSAEVVEHVAPASRHVSQSPARRAQSVGVLGFTKLISSYGQTKADPVVDGKRSFEDGKSHGTGLLEAIYWTVWRRLCVAIVLGIIARKDWQLIVTLIISPKWFFLSFLPL